MKQTCTTCKWAKFEMTNHNPPRQKLNQCGECCWPMPVVVALPLCMPPPSTYRGAIWPNYSGCLVWEVKA